MSNIKLKNNLNTEFSIEHVDNTPAISVTSTDLSKVKSIDTIADLRALTHTPSTVWVSGYHTKGDGAFGSHIFEWDATSTEADNGGTIIKLDTLTTGRYKLKYDGFLHYKWFGLSSFEFYVSPNGSDANNGMTQNSPFLTIQKAADTYSTFRRDIGEDCIINLSDGVYTDGCVVDSLHNDSELIISGESKLGTIIDGTSASTLMGLNFNSCGFVRVKNLTVQNFGLYGSGIMFQNGTTGVVDNVKSHNNSEANFNCSAESKMYVVGNCDSTGTTKYGFRFYGHSRGSLGDGVNNYYADGATVANIQVRDNSRIVCRDGLILTNANSFNNSAGVLILKNSYCELRTTTISNNSIGIYAESGSIFDNQEGVITFSGNTEDKRIVNLSIDRSLFSSSNSVPYLLTPYSNPSGTNATSNADIVLDKNGNHIFEFLSNNNNINISFDKFNYIAHVASDKTLRLSANGAEYRFLDTGFYPSNSNARNLGQPFATWANIYSNNLKIYGSEIDFTGLPTSDPLVAGRVWNNNGVLTVSAG